MKGFALAVAALLAVIQWPLWFGKGGWLRVAELDRQLTEQRASNGNLSERNLRLAAEVASFRTGREAVEERARMQLNMIRGDQLFFQYVPTAANAANAANATNATNKE
jgi:cell division protein FtsB